MWKLKTIRLRKPSSKVSSSQLLKDRLQLLNNYNTLREVEHLLIKIKTDLFSQKQYLKGFLVETPDPFSIPTGNLYDKVEDFTK